MRYAIKSWTSFQHYKDRRPPWIKLHRTLLDDCDFLRLPVACRALAPLLWLLASESEDGTIEGEPEVLAFRLRLDAKEITQGIKGLESIGYITPKRDASDVLAFDKQDTRLETETETETETDSKSTDTQKEINRWFRRKDTTAWDAKERKKLAELLKASCGESPSEFAAVKAWYSAKTLPKEFAFRRRDIATLLNNWNGEADRAKQFIRHMRDNENPSFAQEVDL